MNKKLLAILAVAVFAVFTSSAKTIKVSSAEQVKDLTLNAGDVVILANGTYTDMVINVKGEGTASNPIIFKGKTAGKTILKGKSAILISGTYVVVENLWFENPEPYIVNAPVVQFSTTRTDLAYNCTIRNCMITGYDLEVGGRECKWISMYGTDNVVEHCTFEDKSSMGPTLVIWPDTIQLTKAPSHIIRNNIFTRPRPMLNERGGALNGQETIRLGTSDVSLSSAGCLVESNLFDRCSGEAEIVSVKTCDNIVRNNVFVECVGGLTLRHGNGTTVEGNFFDGGNIDGTGGIRVVGSNHTVRNNFMQNLAGSGSTSALAFMKGITGGALNTYHQVYNAIIENNVAVNCKQGMAFNLGTRTNQNLSLKKSTVENNTFVGCEIAVTVANTPAPEQDVVWSNNAFDGGSFDGCTLESIGGVELAESIGLRSIPTIDAGASWSPKK